MICLPDETLRVALAALDDPAQQSYHHAFTQQLRGWLAEAGAEVLMVSPVQVRSIQDSLRRGPANGVGDVRFSP